MPTGRPPAARRRTGQSGRGDSITGTRTAPATSSCRCTRKPQVDTTRRAPSRSSARAASRKASASAGGGGASATMRSAPAPSTTRMRTGIG